MGGGAPVDRVAQRLQQLAERRAARNPIHAAGAAMSVLVRAAIGGLRYVVRQHSAGWAVQDQVRSGDVVFFHADEALAMEVAAQMNRAGVRDGAG